MGGHIRHKRLLNNSKKIHQQSSGLLRCFVVSRPSLEVITEKIFCWNFYGFMPNFDDGPLGQKCFYYDGVNATTSNMYDGVALSNGMSSHHFGLTKELLLMNVVQNVHYSVVIASKFKVVH